MRGTVARAAAALLDVDEEGLAVGAAHVETDRRCDGAHAVERALRLLRELLLLGERAIQLRGEALAKERPGIGCIAHREPALLWKRATLARCSA